MVRTTESKAIYAVVVTVYRQEGSSILAAKNRMIASDALDYHTQAIGYFRFAIQEMDANRIEVEVITHVGDTYSTIELTEITRD